MTKRTVAVLAVVVSIGLGSAARAVVTNAATDGKTIALVVSNQIDPAMTDQVAAYLRSTFQSEVRLASPVVATPSASIEVAAAIVAGAMKPSDGIALGLVSLTDSNSLGMVAAATGRVAILNVAALKSANADAGRYLRRVKRESGATVARLLGLKACPNPTCCLLKHRDEKELDQKGMNLCPPCFGKAESALRSLGVSPQSRASRGKTPTTETK